MSILRCIKSKHSPLHQSISLVNSRLIKQIIPVLCVIIHNGQLPQRWPINFLISAYNILEITVFLVGFHLCTGKWPDVIVLQGCKYALLQIISASQKLFFLNSLDKTVNHVRIFLKLRIKIYFVNIINNHDDYPL